MSMFSKKSTAGEVSEVERIYEPLPVPHLPGKLDHPPKEFELTSEQQKVLDEVLNHFTDEAYALHSVEDDGALKEEEKFWLSWDCMHRYCRAVKWSSSKAAIKRLEETLVWRREYGLYDMITSDHVEPEALTGKMVVLGYDVDGRPALYLRPSKQNTEENPKQLHFVVWALERCADLMGPGVENIALMVDFADKAKNPSLQTSRATLNILQNHYPERLGRSLVINVPWLVSVFLKMVMPFVDPHTRDKIRFNPHCLNEGLFSADMLMGEWGGALAFEYEHARYWPAINRMCDERRARWMRVWREMGGTVGIKEWDVKVKAEAEAEASVPDEEESEKQVAEADRSEAVTLSGDVKGYVIKEVEGAEVAPEAQPQAVQITA